jgi:CheY-like chemotaxis protein
MSGRQILIADPDPETAQFLAPPLRQRGHTVTAVKNGPRALELCVLRRPDLVLFDLACELLDWQTFRHILRANPRTEHVPVILTGKTMEDVPLSSSSGFLLKPFNVDEVLARIDQVFRQTDNGLRGRRGEQGMEGAIGQLSLVDLLQVLGHSRKTGELHAAGPRGTALVTLIEGHVSSAQAENTRGLKAFFRLLSWHDGTFSFIPGGPGDAGPRDVDKPIEELLLEGLRQSDEFASVRGQLPDASGRLVLSDSAEQVLADQPPISAEIIELARAGATVGEVLERSRATDFLAAHTLLGLLQRRILIPAPGDLSARPIPKPLLSAAVAHALRVSLIQGRREGTRARGKLLVGGAGIGTLVAFLEQLSSIPGCSIALDELRQIDVSFGTVGRLDIAEDLAIDLVQMPSDEASRPLWQPFSGRAIGALIIAPDPSTRLPRALLTFLVRGLAIPVMLAGPSAVPAELEELGPLVSVNSDGPIETIRSLLQQVSQRPRSRFQ